MPLGRNVLASSQVGILRGILVPRGRLQVVLPSCKSKKVSIVKYHIHPAYIIITTMSLISAFRPPSLRSSALRHRSHQPRRPSVNPASSPAVNQESEQEVPDHSSITPSKHTPRPLQALLSAGAPLRPLRLLRQDLQHLGQRYKSDWTVFNQLIFASAVYVFFTNLLPGITFASDLFKRTGKNWGTVEVVLSTGLCGIVFSM